MSKEFYGQFISKKLELTHKDEFKLLAEKLDKRWVKITVEDSAVEAKTDHQLGYYWGLLLPAIHKELVNQGWTTTIHGNLNKSNKPITRERKINIKEAHETVKDLCALIGKDGQKITMSDMDKHQCKMFIDNVLNFAGELGLDVKKLEAQRCR